MVNCLSSSSFGNLYTRKRLALNTSELLTFSIVSILGGCEAQVKAHYRTTQNLVDAPAQMLLYILSHTLNTLSCVNTVLQNF